MNETTALKTPAQPGASPRCAVSTGSPAGDAPPQPKPLMCRLADLMKEWRQTRDNMKARGEDDAAIAVECCMETLHQDVTTFLREMKEWREHCAKQENPSDEPHRGSPKPTEEPETPRAPMLALALC